MSSFSITGQITYVGEPITRGTFTFREFTVSCTENGYIKPYFLQVSQARVNLVTSALLGKEVEVKFNINGTEKPGKEAGTTWKSNTNSAWAVSVIERARVTAETPPPPPANFAVTESVYGSLAAMPPAPVAQVDPAKLSFKKDAKGDLILDDAGNPIIDDGLPF